jgi:ATP synthase protein I
MKPSTEQVLIRGALFPASLIGLVGIVTATVFRGKPGLWGALLAQFVVVIFFAVHFGVSAISRKLDPLTTMALAMFSYLAKIAILGLMLWALTNYTSRQSIDRGSFGVVAIAITVGWLAGEIRSFLKLRMHLPLPIPSSAPGQEQQ